MRTFITHSLIIMAFTMMMTGCYTKKVSQRQIIKAQAIYPQQVAAFCNAIYAPVEWARDSILFQPGEQVIVDSLQVFINCDTAYNGDKKSPVSVKCPTYIQRTDTLFVYKEKQVIDKARTDILQAKLDELTMQYAIKKQSNKLLKWMLITLVIYIVLRWFIRKL